jgi:hypothetical protein
MLLVELGCLMVKAPDWYCLTKFKHSIFCIAKVSRKRKRRRKDSGNDSLIELLFILSPTYYTLHEAFFWKGVVPLLGRSTCFFLMMMVTLWCIIALSFMGCRCRSSLQGNEGGKICAHYEVSHASPECICKSRTGIGG